MFKKWKLGRTGLFPLDGNKVPINILNISGTRRREKKKGNYGDM
jgi:hypothetical protein